MLSYSTQAAIVVVYIPIVSIEIGIVVEVVEPRGTPTIAIFAVFCTAVSAIKPKGLVSQLYFMAGYLP